MSLPNTLSSGSYLKRRNNKLEIFPWNSESATFWFQPQVRFPHSCLAHLVAQGKVHIEVMKLRWLLTSFGSDYFIHEIILTSVISWWKMRFAICLNKLILRLIFLVTYLVYCIIKKTSLSAFITSVRRWFPNLKWSCHTPGAAPLVADCVGRCSGAAPSTVATRRGEGGLRGGGWGLRGWEGEGRSMVGGEHNLQEAEKSGMQSVRGRGQEGRGRR